jgi:hypothetical protein
VTELVLRRAGRDEDAALRALNAAAFDHNPKARAEITAWQWWDNPFGEPLVWVWDDDGVPVAQYIGYCVPGVLRGRPQTFTIGVDAAVAPTHQGRRLFTPLSEALYADAVAQDMPLMAYPNELSYRGIARAGWAEVARLRVHVQPIDDAWLAHRFHVSKVAASALRKVGFRRRRTAAGLVATAVAGVPDDIDELWSAVAPTVANGIARDAAWWRWRYEGHPDHPYAYLAVRDGGGRLVAAVAARIRDDLGGRMLCLLELLAADEDGARAAVNALVDGALGPADGAALTANGGTRLDALAGRCGFRRLPPRLEPLPIRFGLVPHPSLVPDPTALPWSTSWGDLDHI